MIPAWIYALIGAALFASGAVVGAHWQEAHDAEESLTRRVAADRAAALERDRTDSVTDRIGARAAQAAADNAQANANLMREIPLYVPKIASAGCAGFVDGMRLLNNAAASGLPVSEPAAKPDDSAGAAQDLAAVVTANIAQCRADNARFGQLQDWIEGVRK